MVGNFAIAFPTSRLKGFCFPKRFPHDALFKSRISVLMRTWLCCATHPQCQEGEIGSYFVVQCGLCSRWFHVDCIGLTHSSAKEMNENDMEWICDYCGAADDLGKQYLR
jgi:hypothetical protein